MLLCVSLKRLIAITLSCKLKSVVVIFMQQKNSILYLLTFLSLILLFCFSFLFVSGWFICQKYFRIWVLCFRHLLSNKQYNIPVTSKHGSSPPVSCCLIFRLLFSDFFSLFFCAFSFGHCVVCPLRFTDSGYAFGIFILFLSKNDILLEEQSIQPNSIKALNV